MQIMAMTDRLWSETAIKTRNREMNDLINRNIANRYNSITLRELGLCKMGSLRHPKLEMDYGTYSNCLPEPFLS